MPLADQHVRDRIAHDLDSTLVVEAAAGTGKTTALVGRIVAIVRKRKATLNQIIAVTFTEKAAGEMKLRLRNELEKARLSSTDAQESDALEGALEELEVARIGTIHALCADLLREHAIEAAVDPLFEVSQEDSSQLLLEAAFDSWFPEVLKAPPEGIRRLLRRRPTRSTGIKPRERLRRAAWQLIGHRDFDEPWNIISFARDQAIDALLPRIQKLSEYSSGQDRDDYLVKNLLELKRFCEDLQHRESTGLPRDYDGVEAALADLSRHRSWTHRGYGEKLGILSRAQVIAERDSLKVEIDAFMQDAESHLAALLHRELWPLVLRYEEEKDRLGKLDFFDLLIRTKALLLSQHSVRKSLQQRFTHLFVDEFQDTDPLQADILRLLAADNAEETDVQLTQPLPGKLFIVGDPKQSIYRFRRADVALYESIKRQLKADVLDLTTSFRGVPELQDAINSAFSEVMVQNENDLVHTQARYVPLNRARQSVPERPSLIALPVPRPYADFGKITKREIDASFPDAAAAFIDWLINQSGWKIGDAKTGLIPIQARHICILFRRFRRWDGDDVTEGYTHALEARGVPHVLVGGRSFHVREEVLALRNALTAIEWPDDELSVYATLKCPLFALTDDALLTYRHSVQGHLTLFRKVDMGALPESAAEVARALEVLRELHYQRNRRPIADTISELLEKTRAPAGIAFWAAGPQALANLNQLIDLARHFENNGGRSFRGFVERLSQQAERGEVPEAPVVEEASDGVRMMTVHAAKGLEFPVVLLADPTCAMVGKNPSHWVQGRKWAEPLAHCVPQELRDHAQEAIQRDRHEGIRLAYVAATRARDILIAPVVGDEMLQDTWLDPLLPILYPKEDDQRRALPAPGCPAFKGDSVIDRPDKARFRVSVMPGLHRSRLGTHSVVWWDPSALRLDEVGTLGLHQDEVLHEKGGEANGERSWQEYHSWRTQREQLLIAGALRTMDVTPARDANIDAIPISVEMTSAHNNPRPTGKRFGALVHATLAELPVQTEKIQHYVEVIAQKIGAPHEEVVAAIEATQATIAHPLWKRAAHSERIYREVPLTLTLNGALVEGVADLVFLENGVWNVVEFKTDQTLENREENYRKQVSLYVSAVASATGLQSQGHLLLV